MSTSDIPYAEYEDSIEKSRAPFNENSVLYIVLLKDPGHPVMKIKKNQL